MTVFMKPGQEAPVSLQVLNARGEPAAIDGAPIWYSDDRDIASVEGEGLAVVVVARTFGTANVEVEVDADLGDGVRKLVGHATFHVLDPEDEATTIALDVGAVRDRPKAEPQPALEDDAA